jgi:hypothetical protein
MQGVSLMKARGIPVILVSAAAVVGIFGSVDRAMAADEPEAKKETPKETPKPEPKETQTKTDTNYEVKKSHDEHIPATEKAAAEAAEKDKK